MMRPKRRPDRAGRPPLPSPGARRWQCFDAGKIVVGHKRDAITARSARQFLRSTFGGHHGLCHQLGKSVLAG